MKPRKTPPDSNNFFDLDLILSHFAHDTITQPQFPRKISTLKLNNVQVEVFSKEQALNFYKESDYLDCRINAYPSYTEYKRIQRYPPNFIFIDLDQINFKSERSLKLALSNTLRKIEDKLKGHPTVLWTGGGYHIYQPIEAIILENVKQFANFNDPSIQFLRFAEKFLSYDKSDPSHNVSFKSCMIRIPGSYNSKYGEEGIVKIIKKWDGYRSPIKYLLGNFYAYLVDQKIKQIRLMNLNKKYNYEFTDVAHKINWIETLLQTPIDDYRKNAVALILAPYLINVKRISYEESFSTIKYWLDKCEVLRKLNGNFEYLIKYSLNNATKNKRFPMKFDTLITKNPHLHRNLSSLMSNQ